MSVYLDAGRINFSFSTEIIISKITLKQLTDFIVSHFKASRIKLVELLGRKCDLRLQFKLNCAKE
jgi:hypothetical protein